jgi:DUF4097 and DUF4098 domain-containing protein YvlB
VRRESFSTPGPVALELKVPAGLIEVETGGGEQTVVELEPMRDDEGTLAAVEAARIELRERAAGGPQLRVTVDDVGAGVGIDLPFTRGERERGGRRFRFGFFRSPEVLVRVRCPHGSGLAAESGSADILGRGHFGDVKLTTGSGDIDLGQTGNLEVSSASGDVEVAHVAGHTQINTASGDVQLRHVQGDTRVNTASGDTVVDQAQARLEVNSASGDVLVRDLASSATVSTASGDQRLASVGEGEVTMKSTSGDLYVGVRRGTKVWMDVQTRSGDASSDLDVTDEPPGEGAPALELRANTMSGDVRIART